MKEFNYFAPGSVEEALELMKEYEGKYTILNGGTDVMIRLRERLINPEAVIDIKRIPGLKEITFSKKDGLYIGACVTCKEISESEIVKENYPFYAQAASVLGSQLVRGRATSVGNVINASPLADTVTPLVACDAKLVVVGPEGQREGSLVSWAGESQEERIARGAFFIFVRKVGLKPGEMAIGLKIPYVEGQKAVFTKFDRRKEVDLSTVCATVGKFGEDYRVAIGSCAPTPIRLPKTEALLKGKKLTPELIGEAAELAGTEVSPISDVRASAEYRVSLVKVAVRRSLAELSV